MRSLGLAFALTAGLAAAAPISIDSFGAIPWNSSFAAAVANGKAIYQAIQAANNGAEREVLIPAQTNYTVVPFAPFVGVSNIQLTIDGNLIAWLPPNGNSSYWPVDSRGVALDLLAFWQSEAITITTHYGTYQPSSGFGIIDGQGYDWWNFVLFSAKDNRPNEIGMASVKGPILISGLRMVNSPEYHQFLHDVKDLVVKDVDIYVDVEQQQALLGRYGHLTTGEGLKEVEGIKRQLRGSNSDTNSIAHKKRLEALLETFDKEGLLPAGLPTFPLNTDGIDPAGVNVLITNCSITNFDDAVAVKPLKTSALQVSGNCSQNMLIQNSRVKFGVGMTIGSVPPNPSVNCVRNITFDGIFFESPIKGIYIKPNPPIGDPYPAGAVAAAIDAPKQYQDSWERKSDFSSIFGKRKDSPKEEDKDEEDEDWGNDDPSDDPNPPLPPHTDTIGSGIIDAITYRNVYGSGSIWWSIYVGLQQQQQPGNQSNTGCSFFYPILNSTCPLQPRVPVTNLVLKNVTFLDSVLSPGLLRCANGTEGYGYPGYQPCSGWVFEDVTMTSILNWPISLEEGSYLCHGLQDPIFNGTTNPVPKCT